MKKLVFRLALLALSVAVAGVFLIVLEAGARFFFPEINFQGTSKTLIRNQREEKIFGNIPDSEGVSFGAVAHIDGLGMRKTAFSPITGADGSYLVIGDSVTFGVGVEDERTFVAILQKKLPGVRLLNSAVIGSGPVQYKQAAEQYLGSTPGIKKVVLFFCINDVADMDNGLKGNQPDDKGNTVKRITHPLMQALQANSKLFLLLKNVAFDRSRQYTLFNSGLYGETNPSFIAAMKTLKEIAGMAKTANVEFIVTLLPSEYQLRENTPELLKARKLVAGYLSQENIKFIDPHDYFLNAGGSSKDYFLYADDCHLSEKGHQVMADFLGGQLVN
ncbi:MAG: SGNH/GDSL hydrolase family protein [Nitrospinae bacterium]|nr:SGNH/GDSL hydrolase family protein [Nitrospinota bacterium]